MTQENAKTHSTEKMLKSAKTLELRALLRLTLPILATQLAQIGMGTVDTLMSGYISTHDLAAVAIGTSLWLPVWLFLAGILVALSPITAKFNGAGQTDNLPRLLSAALFLGIAFGVVAALTLTALSGLLPWIVEDPTTAEISKQYLSFIALGMPSAGLFLAYRFYAEALNQPGHVTRIMLIGLVLNIPANGLFLYGWFGLPELGGAGCGIGSTLVFTGMAIAMARNTRKHRLNDSYPLWREVRRPDWTQVKSVVALGLPIGIAIFFEVSLFSVIALFLTDLGPVIVAGHQVALNVSSLTFMIPLSLGMALTVRVGHHLGSQQPELARRSAWLGVKVNLALAAFNATLMVTLSGFIASLYSPDPEVVATAAGLLLFAAVFQLSDAIQIAAAGALRGYQDTLPVMIITFVSYWAIGLALGYYLAFNDLFFNDNQPLGAEGFWSGLVIGLTAAAIALSYRLYRVSHQQLTPDVQEKPF